MPTLELKPTHKVVAAYYDIVRLIGQVITVNLETQKMVMRLPEVKFS